MVWVVLWSLVPITTAPVALLAARSVVGGAVAWNLELARYFLWTYVVVGTLVLTPLYVRLLDEAQALVQRFTGLADDDALQSFRGATSTVAPLLLAALMGAVYVLPDLGRYGGWSAAILPLTIVGNIPPSVALWFLIVLFLGLHRLGRLSLNLQPFTTDRSLGLRPFGRLAFWGFLPFAFFVVPLTFLGRGAEVVLNFVILGVGAALFFLSALGLRRQLLRAKAHHVAWARTLFARALAPVLQETNPEPTAAEAGQALRAQSLELLAAAEVERRAAAIQEWPYDEGTLRTFTAIATSVAAATLARFLLSRFGL